MLEHANMDYIVVTAIMTIDSLVPFRSCNRVLPKMLPMATYAPSARVCSCCNWSTCDNQQLTVIFSHSSKVLGKQIMALR